MKKSIFATIVALSSIFTAQAQQQTLIVETNDGVKTAFNVTNIKELVIEERAIMNTSSVELVDLELPSGTKWANMNVGAEKPWEVGSFFAWAETTTKEDYSWSTYFGFTNVSDCGTDKDPLKNNVYPYNLSIAGTMFDAATMNFGKDYMIPSAEQVRELLNGENCEWTWTADYNNGTENTGVAGYIIKSKRNTNHIFLPVTGYKEGKNVKDATKGCYWTVSHESKYSSSKMYIDAKELDGGKPVASNSGELFKNDKTKLRHLGLAIRPVSAAQTIYTD